MVLTNKSFKVLTEVTLYDTDLRYIQLIFKNNSHKSPSYLEYRPRRSNCHNKYKFVAFENMMARKLTWS